MLDRATTFTEFKLVEQLWVFIKTHPFIISLERTPLMQNWIAPTTGPPEHATLSVTNTVCCILETTLSNQHCSTCCILYSYAIITNFAFRSELTLLRIIRNTNEFTRKPHLKQHKSIPFVVFVHFYHELKCIECNTLHLQLRILLHWWHCKEKIFIQFTD